MSLPLLHLSGTPYQQGLAHGAALRAQIAHNIALYLERFERQGRLPRAAALGRAARYLPHIAARSADYMDGLRGIADGAGADLVELAALNVRYEILYYQLGAGAAVDGCTAFAVTPEATDSGHLLIGQNWDWIPGVRGALLHSTDPDGMQTLAFSEAGIFGGKIGLNAAGLGLAVNGITSTDDDWSRLGKPFHVRCYEILRARDLDAAVRVATGAGRACSANYLIAQAPDRAVDIEAAPGGARLIAPEQGCLTHTNHFLDPDALGVAEPPSPRRPGSCLRYERMAALLAERRPVSVAALQSYLRDHAGGICRHLDPGAPPDQQFITVMSTIIDLSARELHLTDGPPCQSDYQRVALP